MTSDQYKDKEGLLGVSEWAWDELSAQMILLQDTSGVAARIKADNV